MLCCISHTCQIQFLVTNQIVLSSRLYFSFLISKILKECRILTIRPKKIPDNKNQNRVVWQKIEKKSWCWLAGIFFRRRVRNLLFLGFFIILY